MEKPQNDDFGTQSMGIPTSPLLLTESSPSTKLENDGGQPSAHLDVDTASVAHSTAQAAPKDSGPLQSSARLNSMTSTLLDPRATPILESLISSKLSLTTLTPGTATPSQISNPVEEKERQSQAGDSLVDAEKSSAKNLITSATTFDHASIPTKATQTPSQLVDIAAQPSQTGEKKRLAVWKFWKKGPPATSLEVPLEPWRMVLVNVALLLAGFMVGLDQSIIGPAIPTIVSQFHSIHDIGAYQSAYLLPQCVLQPMCNKLYSMTSFSTTYISSVIIFGTGSLICATSQSSSALICGRAVAGIGAVGLSLGGFRLLAMLPESKRQNLSMGVFSLFLGCSVVVGPIAGGTITSTINWHWIFWITLPVMGVVLICVLLSTFMNGPDLQGEHAQKPFAEKLQLLDWMGTVLFILTLTPFILALQFAAQYGWNSSTSIAMWVLAGVSLIAFTIQQRHSSSKIFDPVIALNRSVWPTCGLFFSALSAVSVLVLFLPFLLQLVKGVSPRQSGIESFPLAVTITVGTLIFSTVSTIVPFFNPFSLLGTTMLVGACVLFVTLRFDFTIPRLIGYELIAGFGVGMAWLSEIIFPRAALNKYQLATSLGYSRMLQQTGATMSVQIATIVFTTRLKTELLFLGKTAEDISGLLGDLGAGTEIPAGAVPLVIRAYSRSIRAGLHVALICACISLAFAIALPWPRLKGGITDHRRSGEVESNNASTDATQHHIES